MCIVVPVSYRCLHRCLNILLNVSGEAEDTDYSVLVYLRFW